ncbi:hypothetical protein ACSU1N_05945 [Thermogladius sp. 4427co]|uniref:hypothetical protein n=1 Tax=Thermogladius sp. 4427co TaxID=3450718 RepID=UPI003F795D64
MEKKLLASVLALIVIGIALMLVSFNMPKELAFKKEYFFRNPGSYVSVSLWLDKGDMITFKMPMSVNGTLTLQGQENVFRDNFYDVSTFSILVQSPSGLYNLTISFATPPGNLSIEVRGYKFSMVQNLLGAFGLILLLSTPFILYVYYYSQGRKYPDIVDLEVSGVRISCKSIGYDRHECVLSFETDLEKDIAGKVEACLASIAYHHITKVSHSILYARHRKMRNELLVDVRNNSVVLSYRVRKAIARGSMDLSWISREAAEIVKCILSR